MVAKNQDFEMWANNDKRPEITIRDPEGNPVNLDGASVEWVAVKQSDGTEMLRKSTSGGGIAITDAKAGKCIIKIDASDTQGNDTATYDHEAMVTLSDNNQVHVTVGVIDFHASNI